MQKIVKVDSREAAKSVQKENIISSIGPGDFFGEMSFISGHKRTSDVVASAPQVIVLKVDEAMMARLGAEGREKIKDQILMKLVKMAELQNRLLY